MESIMNTAVNTENDRTQKVTLSLSNREFGLKDKRKWIKRNGVGDNSWRKENKWKVSEIEGNSLAG